MPSKKPQPPNLHTVDLGKKNENEVKRLIREYRAGKQQAFDEIVRRYRSPVLSLAYRMTRDRDEAADVAQNVFLKMAANIDRYDERKKFYTWLYRITVNASIDFLRKNQRHRHESLDLVTGVEEKTKFSPEMNYLRNQLREHITKAADTLNEKQRSAFLLRDVGGRKVDDVAGIMEMPEATVRWYLHRARARIRKELLRRCPHLLFMMGIR